MAMVGLFLNDNYLNIKAHTMRILAKHIGDSHLGVVGISITVLI